MAAPDVAIIGGGIVGCAAAAFLAEAGASVELFERDELAGAASRAATRARSSIRSTRCSASCTSRRSRHYRGLDGFELPDEPAGVLMLGPERGRAVEAAAPRSAAS